MNTLLPMAETEMTEKSLIPIQVCDLSHASFYIYSFISEFVESYANLTLYIIRRGEKVYIRSKFINTYLKSLLCIRRYIHSAPLK